MLFQTILDINEVIQPLENKNPYSYEQQNEVYFMGNKTTKGLSLQRIISTNPKDYLNPNYQINKIYHK